MSTEKPPCDEQRRKRNRLLCTDPAELTKAELMSKMNKVVITEFGDESKLAIVEDDLPDPAAGEVQNTVFRNHRAAVPEDSKCIRVLISVDDMFEHVYVSSGGNGLGQICGQQPASGGECCCL
jgi:hypothetical protein